MNLERSPGDQPTPYPDVNVILHELLGNVQAILQDEFVGMYVYGELASEGSIACDSEMFHRKVR